jgi:deferrochelatase/peroxidase EfeB
MQVTDQLASKLLDIINQVQAGIVAHAPDAMQLVLASIQQDGIANLFPGFLCLLGFMGCLILLLFLYKRWKTFQATYPSRDSSNYLFGALPPVALGLFLLMGIFCTLGNYWNYVQIFNPKIYLAHEIIQKVMQ